MNPQLAAIGGGTLVILWWLAMRMIRRGGGVTAIDDEAAREALLRFADRSLELESTGAILTLSADIANAIFSCARVVAFEPDELGDWQAAIPGGAQLSPPSPASRGLFAWFRHNHGIAVGADLGDPRFGAMREPLREVMDGYSVDVLMPLTGRGGVLAVLGLALGRKPARADRELMRMFRLAAAAACANVRLHREAAHLVGLAREADLASAVALALVPEGMEGARAGIAWAGHYAAASAAGSDFFGIYEIDAHRTMVVIGDTAGADLAGAMVAAMVKSCADSVIRDHARAAGPARLLSVLNRALGRAGEGQKFVVSCFAAVVDGRGYKVTFANAGHPAPYHLKGGDPRTLGVLRGGGPLLGDGVDAAFAERTEDFGPDDALVFFTDGLLAAGRAKNGLGHRALQRLLVATKATTASDIRAAILDGASASKRETTDDEAVVVVTCVP
ncbi:MAG TPA: PP2C family protein-serine/threonine phosphatase [Kofleriaceae bacterium]|nr:PP2C family protein-serine/threonine phosphatase [Kofleriaceae bacterium]